MNEELQKFIEWIPQNIEELKDKTPDEIVEVLNNLGQSNEGKKMIETWMSKFKSSTSMFKDGGKMEALVNMLKCGGKPKCKSKSKCGSKYECGGKCKIRKGEDGLETIPTAAERFGEIKYDNRNDFQKTIDDVRTWYKATPFFDSPVFDAITTTAATSAGGAAIDKIAKLAKFAKTAYLARKAKLTKDVAKKAKDASTLSNVNPSEILFDVIDNLDDYMRGSDFDIDNIDKLKRLYDTSFPTIRYPQRNFKLQPELIDLISKFRHDKYIIKNNPINWNAAATGAAGLGALLGLEKIGEDAANDKSVK